MPTRSEQMQAHQFLIGRLASALVRGDPDAPGTPGRRVALALFAGVMLGLLAVAVVGVYGLIVPGGATSWRKPGTLVVERDSGSRYLLVAGVLRPVLNFASARLLVGAQMTVVSVSSASLRGVPHGEPIGIAGAPDTLPAASTLTAAPWSICATSGVNDAGTSTSRVVVTIGAAASSALNSRQALLVRDDANDQYLIWSGHRLRLAGPWVLDALGYGSDQAITVSAGWLSSVPIGPDLRPVPVAHVGNPGPIVGHLSTRVGEVLNMSTPDGSTAPYVVFADGLAALSLTDAALLLADPTGAAAYPAHNVAALPVTAAQVAAAAHSSRSGVTPGFPALPPSLAGTDPKDAACVEVASGGGTPRISLRPAPVGTGALSGIGVRDDSQTADVIVVPPDRGVLVRDLPAPGVAVGAVYLVTDVGVKYPVADRSSQAALGYGGITPVTMPGPVLDLLPTGPVLDAYAASSTSGDPSAAATDAAATAGSTQ